MSFLGDDEPSPWGSQANYDAEPSPWGAASDQEQESDHEVEPAPENDPYSGETPQIDSSQLLGANTPAQGLEFRAQATPEVEEPTPKRSPARRARSSKIKKAVTHAQSIDAGPLAPVAPSPKKKQESTDLGAKLENISLEEPQEEEEPEPTARESDSEDEKLKLAGTLDIHVGDPSKVGDITSAHIVYTINTTTDLPQYPEADGVWSVTRRYRDFRWLYKALVSNNPGCIVPPPPDKQVFGTLNNDFVESRRAALENMLKKVASHPILRVDQDLVAFLTNTDFNEYLKTRVITDEELEAAASTSGFLGLSVFGKNDETDSWLVEKRMELDSLEMQLKGLAKAFDALHQQRSNFALSLTEFASVTTALADVEPTRTIEGLLREFAKVHYRLGELYQRQKLQDTLFIETTVDEQIRLVNSVRDACNAKQRLQVAAMTTRADATKREQQLDKLYKQKSDRVQAAEAEAKVAIEKAENAEKAYAVAAQRVESELSRVDREKIIDFRNAVELYLENAIESQKQSIEIWETFYTRYFKNPSDE